MARTMSAVRALLLLAIVGGGILVTASPCRACDCAARTPAEIVRQADRAFVGRVVDETVSANGTTQTFQVVAVYKGALGPTVNLWVEVGTNNLSSCAVLFPRHERVAVAMTVDAQGRWTTTSCSYLTQAQLREAAGPPHPPTGAVSSPTASPLPTASQTPAVASDLGRDRSRRNGVPLWLVIVLGVFGAVSAIGASLLAGGRHAASSPSFEPSRTTETGHPEAAASPASGDSSVGPPASGFFEPDD
jgi:hypothetical protein